MLAFLWQQEPQTLDQWFHSLEHFDPTWDLAEIETQFTIPSGKRPDILTVPRKESLTLVESLSSGPDSAKRKSRTISTSSGGAQSGDGVRFLLTQKPEVAPAEFWVWLWRQNLGVALISARWQAMAECIWAIPARRRLSGTSSSC